MTNQIQPKLLRLERIGTRAPTIKFSRKDGEVTFGVHSFGPDNYQTVGQEIIHSKSHLAVPGAEHVAELLHAIYFDAFYSVPNSDNLNREIITTINSMKSDLLIFNKSLWTDKGVYVVHDGAPISPKRYPEKLKRLEDAIKDGTELNNGVKISGGIKFAPIDSYNLGDHTPESLAKDGFVTASYGEDGAKRLSEVSKKLSYDAVIRGVEIEKGDSHKETRSYLGISNRDHKLYLGAVSPSPRGVSLARIC